MIIVLFLLVKYVLTIKVSFFPITSNDIQISENSFNVYYSQSYDFKVFPLNQAGILKRISYITEHDLKSEINPCSNNIIYSTNVEKDLNLNDPDLIYYNTSLLFSKALIEDSKHDIKKNLKIYICLGYINNNLPNNEENIDWVFQGKEFYFNVRNAPFVIPIYVTIIAIIILLFLSALFSGLNIGLMTLTKQELELIISTGSIKDRQYAKNIKPLRSLGNVLLVTILLSNTCVNSSMTILIDSISSGTLAIIISTISIMVFGEILPQSICTRFPLLVGSYTRYIMWFFIGLTSIVSYPFGKLINLVLGDETITEYGRQQLLEIVNKQHIGGKLATDEVGIISGALNFKTRKVADIMVPIENCFLLSEEAILDFNTIATIVQSGFSRIPVYSGSRDNIVALLNLKDLTFVDPDDKVPLISVVNFYNRKLIKVFSDVTIDKVFSEFKKGIGHLAVVVRLELSDEKDPLYKATGLVTLEDIIEEIIQEEIIDETDTQRNPNFHTLNTTLNVELINYPKPSNFHILAPFFAKTKEASVRLTSSTILTACQFLSSVFIEFSEEYIKREYLQKLITHKDVAQMFSPENEDIAYLYKKDQPSEIFTLILEGKVEIQAGCELITCIQGPFSSFGKSCIKSTHKKTRNVNFIPDFTIRVIEPVLCLRINSTLYFEMMRLSKESLDSSSVLIPEKSNNVVNLYSSDSQVNIETKPNSEFTRLIDDEKK